MLIIKTILIISRLQRERLLVYFFRDILLNVDINVFCYMCVYFSFLFFFIIELYLLPYPIYSFSTFKNTHKSDMNNDSIITYSCFNSYTNISHGFSNYYEHIVLWKLFLLKFISSCILKKLIFSSILIN